MRLRKKCPGYKFLTALFLEGSKPTNLNGLSDFRYNHQQMSRKRPKRVRRSKKEHGSPGFDWSGLAKALQLILALIVPFVFLEGLYNYVDLPRAVLIQGAVVLILLVWLLGAASQNELKILRTPFDLPLLGFVSWAGLSLLWAHNFYGGFEIWTNWGACFILFFLTVNLFKSKRDIRRLLAVLLLAGTFIALLGICQYLLEVNWVPQMRPPAATFANRNMVAQFMVVTIPLAVSFFLISQKRHHVLLTAAALGLLGLFLFHTSTRTAWLAVTVEFLLFAILLGRDHFRWQLSLPMGVNKKQALAVCALVVFVFINLTPSGFQWQVGTAVRRILEVLPGAQPQPLPVSEEEAPVSGEGPSQLQPVQDAAPAGDSLSVRLRLWKNTLYMGKEHLLTGVGVGNFPVLYPRYKRSAVVDPVFNEGREWRKAHNDYAQTFAELGVVGLFFLAWLLLALIKTAIAVLDGGTHRDLRYLLMGVVVALSGLSISAFFRFPFQLATPTFIFALYLGVLGGYSSWNTQPENSVRQGRVSMVLPSWTVVVGVAVAFLLLLILLPFQYHRLMADRYYRKVDALASQQDWAAAILQAREGYRHNPYRKEFLFQMGRAQLQAGDADAAIETTEEFLEAYPYYINAHHNMGVAYASKGDMDRALQHFDRVFEIIAEYGVSHYMVAQIYESRNELDEALEHYRLAVEDDSSNPKYRERLDRLERLIEQNRD